MIINCISDTHIVNGILIFGLFRPILNKATKEQLKKQNLDFYCNAIDQNNTIYQIYCDYDPCLKVSKVVAVPITNEKENSK